jgi:hypothetical protein
VSARGGAAESPALRRRRERPRDQDASPFHVILDELLTLQPFVRSAAIFDYEGETVDYAGDVDPYELRVAAATFQLVINDLRGSQLSSATHEIALTTTRSGYVLRILDESYTLLLLPRRLATFAVSARLLREVEARILHEAGLPMKVPPTWFHVHAEVGARGRPERVRPPTGVHPWTPVEVLGSVMGLAAHETGFRVRLSSGAEVTLIRESPRLWFVDDKLDGSPVGPVASEVFRRP